MFWSLINTKPLLIFWEKQIDSGSVFYMLKSFYGEVTSKNLSNLQEILQKNPWVGSGITIFIFGPCDYLGFLTNAGRGAMRSKTQWVFYRDLDWWPGPQKVQFREITTGYPEVVGLILALLKPKIWFSWDGQFLSAEDTLGVGMYAFKSPDLNLNHWMPGFFYAILSLFVI